MRKLLRLRREQGTPTSPYPGGETRLPERFRGRPVFEPERCPAGCRDCAGLPTPLLAMRGDGLLRIDLGACLFSPEEEDTCPHGAVRFTPDWRLAAREREELVVAPDEEFLTRSLDERMQRLFGRSLRLRSVSAGSCNGCEAELAALGNVVFDLARFGIQFVASPRHADGIVLTGAVSENMRSAVYATWDAVPDPRLVIAVGACAINGGPFRGSPEVGDGAPPDLPVDLWIPGCPPHPLTILDGLLRLLGRLEEPGSAAGA